MQKHLPQHPKRIETVHVETLDGELCLYDWQRMQVHNLNPTAARVWELCDGQTSPAQMAAQLHGDLTPAQAKELVWLSLKRLEQAHLLENKVVQPAGRKVYTRREMLTKLGVTALMLPVISTIVAPGPVEAQSGGGGGPAGPITRTVTVGTLPADSTDHYYAFTTPITDAEIAAYEAAFGAINQNTVSWDSGNNNPTHETGIRLVQVSGSGAFGYAIIPIAQNSPSIYTNSSSWTGTRPFNGLDGYINNASADFVMGNVTITLEHI